MSACFHLLSVQKRWTKKRYSFVLYPDNPVRKFCVVSSGGKTHLPHSLRFLLSCSQKITQQKQPFLDLQGDWMSILRASYTHRKISINQLTKRGVVWHMGTQTTCLPACGLWHEGMRSLALCVVIHPLFCNCYDSCECCTVGQFKAAQSSWCLPFACRNQFGEKSGKFLWVGKCDRSNGFLGGEKGGAIERQWFPSSRNMISRSSTLFPHHNNEGFGGAPVAFTRSLENCPDQNEVKEQFDFKAQRNLWSL